jgi:hypothetical protein
LFKSENMKVRVAEQTDLGQKQQARFATRPLDDSTGEVTPTSA